MSSDEQREELIGVIYSTPAPRVQLPRSVWPFPVTVTELADQILAAGYRKPWTVETVEELDALPDGSLVLADGDVYRRKTNNIAPGFTFRCLDDAIDYREWEPYSSKTVFYQHVPPSPLVLWTPGDDE